MFRYRDRYQAGKLLAEHLQEYADRPDAIVLALPRGGVPVGYEVATALHVPLDVFLVRKLGLPGHEELAMGAIASGGVRFLNEDVVAQTGVSRAIIDQVAAVEEAELERRERAYRGSRPAPKLENATAILVDDGLATGASMHAAALAARAQHAREVVVAVPVAAEPTCRSLSKVVDRVVCPFTPDQFYAVGLWYEDFAQTDDDEVRDLPERASRAGSAPCLHVLSPFQRVPSAWPAIWLRPKPPPGSSFSRTAAAAAATANATRRSRRTCNRLVSPRC